jgi:thiosulfate reductase cytochrome b subunit
MATNEGGRTGHSRVVRITHWVTTVAFAALVVSGYVITMTHPRLYWGDVGNIYMPAWIDLPIERKLGESGWGRSLHFLSAWILVLTGMIYVVWGLFARHVTRDLLPRRAELDLAHVRQEVTSQRHWRVHKDGPAPHYGLLQKSTYLFVIFVLIPLVVLTGLTLSPAVTAAYPLLRVMFGGHQSARTIHFLDSLVLLLFFVVHVIMVVRSGFWRQIRAMTIGERSYGEHAHLATQAIGHRR